MMSLEQKTYGAGWEYCTHCGTYRPERHLDSTGKCLDSTWCGKQARKRRKSEE